MEVTNNGEFYIKIKEMKNMSPGNYLEILVNRWKQRTGMQKKK